MSWSRVVISCGAVALLSGCLPVGWATPPMRADLGVGVTRAEGVAPGTPRVDTHVDVRGALMPLQLFEGLEERPVDVGFGWGARFVVPNDQRVIHGPFVELGALFYPARRGRLGVGMQLHALGTNVGPYRLEGSRAVLRVHYEWVTFASSDSDVYCDGDFCGVAKAYGEGGLGLYAELSSTRLPIRISQEATVGVLIRLPTSAGVGFVAADLGSLL